MLAYQRDYVRVIYNRYGHDYEGFTRYAGVFTTGPKATGASRLEVVSASTAVVSALIPVVQLFPGGNDGSVWMGSRCRCHPGARYR
jgi:hypothetical protein